NPGQPPNHCFSFEGSFYLRKRKLAFDSEERRWYTLQLGDEPSFWVLDEDFEGESKLGGVEQLTDSALQRWKKENEPLTVVVTTNTPTESPRVTYRESREPSIGESSSEQEEDEEEDPFKQEEEESKLEYIEDVHIPTTEQATEDTKAAEIVSALSLETEPVLLPPLPTFTTPFTPPKFSPIFTASTKKMASSSSAPKIDKMKLKPPSAFEGKRKDLNNFLAKCNLYFTYQEGVTPKEKILFVMYLLDGRVADWRNTKVAEYNATPNKWKDFDAFIKELKVTWGEVDESGMALHRLFHYKKLKRTSLNEYVARVDQDLIQSGIADDKTKAHLLLLGLPTLMKERLRYGGAPTTYTALRSRILDLEVANKLYSDFKYSHDPDAMQVDRMVIRQTATEWIANAKCY
ncbi:MAG TPA: hypothetical protein VEP90_25740, partial [Methylomirabilota bacterium]|nr:hypothetical protein [Methylomirabilota bacterium]